ncbi:hypothetical protein DSLASN_21210 [Desulfoluna limicola]|uniref:Polysaccharide chain length determinant N-terminal domain-containing protein n=1 Tax=Desulfoluna limicola TaxID=2810562 RepID=A0ABM7PFW7_9BACT|nr:Wzz/FepE/Etk N-terminal domain-containing protein [Desulfoluna limicola]BCS96489.1 hypothetical protein DSLASN_21210 [Desulfoluna limicola]
MTSETSNRYPIKNESMQPYQSISYADDEIDLKEIFATLWRCRNLISLGVLVFVFSAVVIVFTMPDVYRVKSLVSPGIVSREPGGEVKFTNNLQNYKGQIDAGAYTTRLDKLLSVQDDDMRYSSKRLRASIPKNSSALLISYDTTNKDFGMAVLGHLISLLSKEDHRIITEYVEGLQVGIELNEKSINEYCQQIDLFSKCLNDLEKEKHDIQQQVSATIKSTDIYSAHGVKSLAASAVSEESLYKALLYNNMVVQNRQNLADLNKELSGINSQIDSYITNRQSIAEVVRELRSTVDESSRIIKNIKPFQEIIPIMTEDWRVGPKRGLIVILSFVGGLLFMILLAFTVEYFKPNK